MRMKNAVQMALLVIPVLLSGCATFHQAHQIQERAESKIAKYQPPAPPPVVSTVNQPWLMGETVSVRQTTPDVLRRKITLISSSPLTIRQIASRIGQISGIPVSVENIGKEKSGGTELPPLPGSSDGALSSSSGSDYASNAIPLNWNGSIVGLLNRRMPG